MTRRAFVLASAFISVTILCATTANAQWSGGAVITNSTQPGQVGINTTPAADATLHVHRASTPGLVISDGVTNANFRFGKPAQFEGDFTFNSKFDGTSWTLDVTTLDGKDFAIAETGFYWYTFPKGAGPRTARPDMTLDNVGNLGVGTSSPTSKLHVIGTGNITGSVTVGGDMTVAGNIAAKYQDLAEWVDSDQELSAGMVVVLDPVNTNHVITAGTEYDTTVAGVVSSQPGIILGEAGPGKAKIATTGRVKVKVDARRHAIRVGDLLTTSSTPGVAMRSEPVDVAGIKMHRPGTLIGKALEPLAGGVGEVLVLLSLQ